jgi:hypothetical protein
VKSRRRQCCYVAAAADASAISGVTKRMKKEGIVAYMATVHVERIHLMILSGFPLYS